MAGPPASRAGVLQLRALALAEGVIRLSRRFTRSTEAHVIRGQIVRSATSAAANYRSACRAQSPHAFVAKLSIAIEEADETLLWLKLAVRVGLASAAETSPLAKEADEIVRILVASRKTMRARLDKRARSNGQ